MAFLLLTTFVCEIVLLPTFFTLCSPGRTGFTSCLVTFSAIVAIHDCFASWATGVRFFPGSSGGGFFLRKPCLGFFLSVSLCRVSSFVSSFESDLWLKSAVTTTLRPSYVYQNIFVTTAWLVVEAIFARVRREYNTEDNSVADKTITDTRAKVTWFAPNPAIVLHIRALPFPLADLDC